MHRLRILAGFSALALSATPLAAQERNAADCAPERGLVSIAGIVRDTTGAGIPNVLVRAYGPEADSIPTGPLKLRNSSARVLRTDSTGAFCLRDLVTGRYVVNPRRMLVSRDDFSEQEIAVDVRTPDMVYRIDAVYDPRALSLAEQARREALRQQLAENRAKWAAQRPERYRARITTECDCAEAAEEPTVLVVGDSVAQVVSEDSVAAKDSAAAKGTVVAKRPATAKDSSVSADSPAPAIPEALSHATIDRMFERIERALLDPMLVVQEVQFHAELGFPTLFRTDARRPLSDTGRTHRIPVFEVVEQP